MLCHNGTRYLFAERPSSGIAGWRGVWIERIGSEGTWPALLPAGPVPERWNVKSVLMETPDGPAISWTSPLAFIWFLQADSYEDSGPVDLAHGLVANLLLSVALLA